MPIRTIRVRQTGNFTLRVDPRTKYGVADGAVFPLIDMGAGAFLPTPRSLQVDRLGDQAAENLAVERVSQDDLLNTRTVERERYYQENDAKE
ncbi:MAG TPA: hypothetical protein PKG95_09195 [Anaerolineaceae bacterium]|nr:hypothetical protein [Anaerolineaceae bacterium]